MKKNIILLLQTLFIIAQLPVIAQTAKTKYYLSLRQEKVNKGGKEVTGMTMKQAFPGRPALY